MRYPRSYASTEDRLLFALDAAEAQMWVTQTDVIRLARMDPTTAIAGLKRLTQGGQIEWTRLFRGRGNGSGRPAFLYRRRQTQREAA